MTKLLRHIIKNFVPGWFTVTMGTGILGISIHNLPYHFAGTQIIGLIFFYLNCILFSVFSIILATKYILYPKTLRMMLGHPSQSVFIGTIAMGLTTIINSIVMMFPKAQYPAVPAVTLVLWWIDVMLMLFSVFVVFFYTSIFHKHSFQTVFPTWILPLVPSVVTASSGAVVATVQPLGTAKYLMTLSYIFWGMGLPLTFCVTVIYFARLAFHGLPPPDLIMSTILPVGPMGQGSFGIISLGELAYELSRESDISSYRIFGESALGTGILTGLLMWGFAAFWLIIATAFILFTFRKVPLKFNIGWWGISFPLGVVISSTDSLAKFLDSSALRVISAALTIILTVLWVYVFMLTCKHTIDLSLFKDPSIEIPIQQPSQLAQSEQP